MAVDLRGVGETEDDPGERRRHFRVWNSDHRVSQLAQHTGHPILIQRVEDTIVALEYLLSLPDIDKTQTQLTSVGDAGIIALHAAAFDERFTSITVINAVSSWLDIVQTPLAKNHLRNVVPGALQYYDLADLVEVIKPRNVETVNPVDAFGQAVKR